MFDKLDKFLAFGEKFDWVTPLCDLHKDIFNGPHHDFHIDRYAGWSAGRIMRLLKKNGVQPWGLSYTNELISLRVRAYEAPQAQRILQQKGMPILGGLV